MSFRERLEEVCRGVEGAVACSLMGVDGIEVDTHLSADPEDVDLKNLLVEYSSVFRSAREAADVHQAGGVEELSISTERLQAVVRLVTPEYFMVAALVPGSNLGKARFLLRVAAPKLKAEL